MVARVSSFIHTTQRAGADLLEQTVRAGEKHGSRSSASGGGKDTGEASDGDGDPVAIANSTVDFVGAL
jgi:hypothetical protein